MTSNPSARYFEIFMGGLLPDTRQPTQNPSRKFSPYAGRRPACPIPNKCQPTNFFAAILALWPPKPNELLMTAFTFSLRAVLGT